jgi:hypothetical protein
MKEINYTDYSPFSMLQLQDVLARDSERFIQEKEKDREAEILNYLDNINFQIQQAWLNKQNDLVLKVNDSLYNTHKLKSELEGLGFGVKIHYLHDPVAGEKTPEEIVIQFVEVHGEFYKDYKGYHTKEQILADIRKNCEAMNKNFPERCREVTDELVEKIFNNKLGGTLKKVNL